MTPVENRQGTRAEKRPEEAHPPVAGPDRTVLALLRVGTRGCRLAAAFMAVVVGLMAQTSTGALAETRQTVLYLDAPSVSKDRASRAGEVANAYADPGSPAPREALAWLDVPVRPADVSEPPEYARAAFASVTAPNGEGAGALTADIALRAGEVMLAQIDEDKPPEGRGGDGSVDEGMAAAGAVRPQLGDGTRAPETDRVADPPTQLEGQPRLGDNRPNDAGIPEYASAPSSPATSEEPSGGTGIVVPTPYSDGEDLEHLHTEFAAVTPPAAVPEPALGAEDESYGPTGPVSDVGEEFQEQPRPDQSHLGVERPAARDELAQDHPLEEGTEENFSPAGPPAAPPAGLTRAETGPTGEKGDEVALVPVSDPNGGDGASTATPPAARPAETGSDIVSDDFAPAEPSPVPEQAPEDSLDRPGVPPTAAGPADEAGEPQAEIVIEGGEPQPPASPEAPYSEDASEDQPVEGAQGQEATVVQGFENDLTNEAKPADEGGGARTPEKSIEILEEELTGDEVNGHSGLDAANGTEQRSPRITRWLPTEGVIAGTGDAEKAETHPPGKGSMSSPTAGAVVSPKTIEQPDDGSEGTANETAARGRTAPADGAGTRAGASQDGISRGVVPQARLRTRDVPNDTGSRSRSHPGGRDNHDSLRHGNEVPDVRGAGDSRPAGPVDRMQESGQDAGVPPGGGALSLTAEDAKPEGSGAPRALERGSSPVTSRWAELRLLQSALDSAQRGGSEASQALQGTDAPERGLAGAGQAGAGEEEGQESSSQSQYVAGGPASGGSTTSLNPYADFSETPDRAVAEQAGRERVAARQSADEQASYQQRLAAEEVAQAEEAQTSPQSTVERQNAATRAGVREQGWAGRIPAQQAPEAQTDAHPGPDVSRRTEPVYQEPTQQAITYRSTPAPQVPRQQLGPALQSQQAIQQEMPAAGVDSSLPAHPAQQGTVDQAAQPGEFDERTAETGRRRL